MKGLEIHSVVTQVRHVFGGESIVWRMWEG